MSSSNLPRKRLPIKPSAEHLRKQAKRKAKAHPELKLAEAQQQLAMEYGCKTWTELVHVVETMNRDAEVNARSDVIDSVGGQTPIFHAISNAQLDMTQKLIAAGDQFDLADQRGNTPLWMLCKSLMPASDRLAVARLILENGAAVRRACENQSTALHQAAAHGPVEMVELLLRYDAKPWQADRDGKLPLDYARAGNAADKQAIIELLDRPVISDPNFKAAVRAIQAGDLPGLKSILLNHPQLVHDRAIEPDCYAPSYFSNPKLLWFVASNPVLIAKMPENIVQICQTIIDAGAASEDLDYALDLVMTGSSAREQNQQIPLMQLLLNRGARPGDLLGVLGHGELQPIRFLLKNGYPITAPIAAALGEIAPLKELLPTADTATIQNAFGIAVINRQHEAARICLTAGANVNEYLPVHVHSLPVHQAAVNDDVEMLQLLIQHNAKLDIRDKLWNATPLGWATHTSKKQAETCLRSVGAT